MWRRVLGNERDGRWDLIPIADGAAWVSGVMAGLTVGWALGGPPSPGRKRGPELVLFCDSFTSFAPILPPFVSLPKDATVGHGCEWGRQDDPRCSKLIERRKYRTQVASKVVSPTSRAMEEGASTGRGRGRPLRFVKGEFARQHCYDTNWIWIEGRAYHPVSLDSQAVAFDAGILPPV